MRNQKLFILLAIVTLIGIGSWFLYREDVADNGRAYANKTTLCRQFAQSYLRTIQKTEPNFNNEKWEMAIDIETELYDMCLLDLNKESLKNYKTTALEKYRK